jgi:hypothetical protein
LQRSLKVTKPLFFCVLLVVVAFATTLAAVLSTKLPIGSDYYWHLNLAKSVASGNINGAVNFVLSPSGNSFPYGLYLSVFHFALVPTVWSGQPYLFAQILQVLFLPCTLALTIWIVYRFGNPKAAVYTGMTLLASWAFFDGALQVRPESLDLLLYPLVVAAILGVKKNQFIAYTLVASYNHGLAAISMIYGLVATKLRDKSWKKTITIALLAVLPVIIVSVLYVQGAFSKWGGAGLTENPQEVLFWADPTFIPYYMGATFIGLFFLFKREKSGFEKLVLWGFIGNLVMLPLWADRWLHYASLPLAILTGLGITGLQSQNKKMVLVLSIFTILIVYVASYFSFSLGIGGRFWQPGD